MEIIGVMIRKIERNDDGELIHSSPKLIEKQILRLHQKLKKKDNITTEYSIEKDNHKRKYHSHLIIHYTHRENLYNQLSRFIGGSKWTTKLIDFQEVISCSGKWGEVDTHKIYDEIGFRNYINKTSISKTLI